MSNLQAGESIFTVSNLMLLFFYRIVVYGEELANLVNSAGIYNFTKELELTEAEVWSEDEEIFMTLRSIKYLCADKFKGMGY